MIEVDRAAMALMDKMSTDGHEVNYNQCREYAVLVVVCHRAGIIERHRINKMMEKTDD